MTALPQASSVKDVDVVVVHYPSVAELERCLRDVAAARPRVATTTVVDNAAPEAVPGRIRRSQGIDVVERRSNAGFAAAANQGASRGEAPLILFANPDVRFSPTAIADLARVLGGDGASAPGGDSASVPGGGAPSVPGGGDSSGSRMVAAGPGLTMPDGRPQVGAAGFFPAFGTVIVEAFPLLVRLPGRWADRSVFLREPGGFGEPGEFDEPGEGAVRDVDWVSGAFMLVLRRAFEAVGGFDERFFMYGEDIDLCLRFHQRGWRVGYCPGIRVLHHHGAGDQGSSRPSARLLWLDGLDRYYRLHRPRSRRLLHGIAALGFGLRALAYGSGMARPRSEPRGAGRRLAGYARRALSLALAR